MFGNELYRVEGPFEQTLQDEIYLSDDEIDLPNTAIRLDSEDSYMSDEECEQLGLYTEMKERVFQADLDLVNKITPETCLQDSKELLGRLLLCLDKFDEKQGKSYLDLLNEIGFKVLEKIDRHCEPSIERRNLSKLLNEFCDKVDAVAEKMITNK